MIERMFFWATGFVLGVCLLFLVFVILSAIWDARHCMEWTESTCTTTAFMPIGNLMMPIVNTGPCRKCIRWDE